MYPVVYPLGDFCVPAEDLSSLRRLGPQWLSATLSVQRRVTDRWQRITPSASTHLGRLTYGQEVAGSTVVHLEPLDGELAVASHWVVMDAIMPWIESHAAICLILSVVLGIWPVGLFMLWTLAKSKGMTMKEYAKKHQGRNRSYHGGGD